MKHTHVSALITAVALTAAPQCAGSPSSPESCEGHHVLLVGNSLTYGNSLPAIVEALADSAGVETLCWGAVAFPDYALEDHWATGEARREIGRGIWEVVVLQQGPSSLPENRALLIEYTRRFSEEIRAAGGRPALYMVWPSVSRASDFDAVSASYAAAAQAVDGMLFPVGEAWRAAWRLDADIELYAGDGFHPNVTGSYLAALVMLQQLYDVPPTGLPAELSLRGGATLRIPVNTAARLQAAAAEANERFGRR
ncbi:MAG: hypothetical protein ACREMQ_08765 [Longimicrobiales bacterium]